MKKYKIHYSNDRVAEARETLLDLRHGRKPQRIPFEYVLEMQQNRHSFGDRVRDIGKELEFQADWINNRLHEFPDTDYIPHFTTVHLGQGLIPTMFGAKQLIAEDSQPYIEGRILPNLAEGLPKLKRKIDPDTDGWGPILKQTVQIFLEATGGEIPVHVCDIQSPYGIATKLLGNEDLMMAMYDTPELVHELMGIATDAITDTIRAMERWAGDPELIVKNYNDPMPGGGLVLYDDYISVLTPALHEEFCLPYNQRLYSEFGRGHLHTCGPYFPRYLDAVLKNNPVSIDSNFLRGITRTRDDLLQLRRTTLENQVVLHGSLITNAEHFLNAKAAVMPDEALVHAMADHGYFYWFEWGNKEKGITLYELWSRTNKRQI